jgi:hypothetical protein
LSLPFKYNDAATSRLQRSTNTKRPGFITRAVLLLLVS